MLIFLCYGQNSEAVGHVDGTDNLDAMELLEILLHAPYVKVDFLAFSIERPQINHETLGSGVLLSLSMGLIRSCCSQSLSCAVSWAESSGFMALCFMFTGVSSPGLSSTLATIQSVLPATPCLIIWSLWAPQFSSIFQTGNI